MGNIDNAIKQYENAIDSLRKDADTKIDELFANEVIAMIEKIIERLRA
jgi:hypothetical protein